MNTELVQRALLDELKARGRLDNRITLPEVSVGSPRVEVSAPIVHVEAPMVRVDGPEAPIVNVAAPVVYVAAAAVPAVHVAAAKEPVINVVVDTGPLAAEYRRLAEAVEGQNELMSQLIQVLSERKRPVVRVMPAPVEVQAAPSMVAPAAVPPGSYIVRHSDGTTSTIERQ